MTPPRACAGGAGPALFANAPMDDRAGDGRTGPQTPSYPRDDDTAAQEWERCVVGSRRATSSAPRRPRRGVPRSGRPSSPLRAGSRQSARPAGAGSAVGSSRPLRWRAGSGAALIPERARREPESGGRPRASSRPSAQLAQCGDQLQAARCAALPPVRATACPSPRWSRLARSRGRRPTLRRSDPSRRWSGRRPAPRARGRPRRAGRE
jgi:hypothetical protein